MQRGVPVVQIGSTSKDKTKLYRFFNSPKDTLGGSGYQFDSALIRNAVEAAYRIALDYLADASQYQRS